MIDALSALGFGPFFETQLRALDDETPIPARIAAEHRGIYELWAADGAGPGKLAGRLRRELRDAGYPGVGDWVVVKEAPGRGRTVPIQRVLSRRTVFTRGAAGRESRVQVIAANADLVLVVCGLDADYNVRRIERYLARIWASGARPAVVLNKSDLCEDPERRVSEVRPRAGDVPVIAMSALRREGIEAARSLVRPGMTVALVGSSGAGKSTLVNSLLAEERMRTGDVRPSDGRGRHVTTHRQMVRLPGGGLLLDTPGMRELAIADEAGLDDAFADVAELAARCRYRDCAHESEPGCAVKQAVESGALSAERLEHLHALGREARANELRHDVRLRRQAERRWGALHDEVALLRRWKGGKP